MMRHWLGWSACALGVGMAVAPAASAAQESLTCGETITHSVKVAADLTCPPNGPVGVTIGAANITINLEGHTLSSTSGTTISDSDFDGLVIRNGSVESQGDFWVDLENVSDARIVDVDSNAAAYINGGGGDTITDSGFDGNNEGLQVHSSDDFTMTGTTIDAGSGATPITGDDEVIAHDTFTGETSTLTVTGSGNVVRKDSFVDLSVAGGSGNEVLDNTDTPVDQEGDGISVAASATGTLIRGNDVSGSAGNGITVLDPTARIVDNTADDNVRYGIDATVGDTGHGNEASGNGGVGGMQCANITCSAAP